MIDHIFNDSSTSSSYLSRDGYLLKEVNLRSRGNSAKRELVNMGLTEDFLPIFVVIFQIIQSIILWPFPKSKKGWFKILTSAEKVTN